jgi:SAM-dependent methyltransferase
MNQRTVAALNAINREFYHHRAEDFSSTRQSPWRGWARLLEQMKDRFDGDEEISVLDVGCGNGRFARYLSDHYPHTFAYMGIDISSRALGYARDSIPDAVPAELLEHDIVSGQGDSILPPEANRTFSLVVAFGLLHHVPGAHIRRDLLAALSQRLDHQGILALSIWQFGGFERFRRKIVPWEELEAKTGADLDLSQLEPGDYILSWGADPPAYRYCHFMAPQEAGTLLASLPLKAIDSYEADGSTDNMNRYYLLGSGVKS